MASFFKRSNGGPRVWWGTLLDRPAAHFPSRCWTTQPRGEPMCVTQAHKMGDRFFGGVAASLRGRFRENTPQELSGGVRTPPTRIASQLATLG